MHAFTTWDHKVHTFLPSNAIQSRYHLPWLALGNSVQITSIQHTSLHCAGQGTTFHCRLAERIDSHLPAPTSKGCHGSLEIMKLSPFLELSSSLICSNHFISFQCLPSGNQTWQREIPFGDVDFSLPR